MNLQGHIDTLGLKPVQLASHAKVPLNAVKRAIDGEAITAHHAEQIVAALNTHHGLHALIRPYHLTIKDIDGLLVLGPGELKGKGASGDGSGTGMA